MILAVAEEDRQLTAGLVQLSMTQVRKNWRGRYPIFIAEFLLNSRSSYVSDNTKQRKKLGKISNIAPAQVSITFDCLLDVRMESIYSI